MQTVGTRKETIWQQQNVRSVVRRTSRLDKKDRRKGSVRERDVLGQSFSDPSAFSAGSAGWEKGKPKQSVCVWIVERSSESTFGPIRRTLGVVGDWIGCHQLPERSFFLNGTQFPVCARCTGVLLAQTITGVLAIAGHFGSFLVGALLMAPMGIDWAVQYSGIQESTNVRRFVTGLLGGAGYMTLFVNVVVVIGNKMLQQSF